MKIVDGSFIAVTGAGIIYYQSTLGSNSSDASDSVAIARNATNARWHIYCVTFVCSMSRYVTACCEVVSDLCTIIRMSGDEALHDQTSYFHD
jgi:hypothetical protein